MVMSRAWSSVVSQAGTRGTPRDERNLRGIRKEAQNWLRSQKWLCSLKTVHWISPDPAVGFGTEPAMSGTARGPKGRRAPKPGPGCCSGTWRRSCSSCRRGCASGCSCRCRTLGRGDPGERKAHPPQDPKMPQRNSDEQVGTRTGTPLLEKQKRRHSPWQNVTRQAIPHTTPPQDRADLCSGGGRAWPRGWGPCPPEPARRIAPGAPRRRPQSPGPAEEGQRGGAHTQIGGRTSWG